MTFLDEAPWRGKAFSGGWKAVSGGEAPVTEPATGAELGRVGVASRADIAAAATAAAAGPARLGRAAAHRAVRHPAPGG